MHESELIEFDSLPETLRDMALVVVERGLTSVHQENDEGFIPLLITQEATGEHHYRLVADGTSDAYGMAANIVYAPLSTVLRYAMVMDGRVRHEGTVQDGLIVQVCDLATCQSFHCFQAYKKRESTAVAEGKIAVLNKSYPIGADVALAVPIEMPQEVRDGGVLLKFLKNPLWLLAYLVVVVLWLAVELLLLLLSIIYPEIGYKKWQRFRRTWKGLVDSGLYSNLDAKTLKRAKKFAKKHDSFLVSSGHSVSIDTRNMSRKSLRILFPGLAEFLNGFGLDIHALRILRQDERFVLYEGTRQLSSCAARHDIDFDKGYWNLIKEGISQYLIAQGREERLYQDPDNSFIFHLITPAQVDLLNTFRKSKNRKKISDWQSTGVSESEDSSS